MALFGRNGGVHAPKRQCYSFQSGEKLEEVLVYGIRASLRESLESKRQATGVEDDLTAEDVGKFPDKNLAEALQRVPGVVINREFARANASICEAHSRHYPNVAQRSFARDGGLVHS